MALSKRDSPDFRNYLMAASSAPQTLRLNFPFDRGIERHLDRMLFVTGKQCL